MDSSQLLQMKREIVSTTNTQGWRYIKELAERIVGAIERDAIDEEDDGKGNLLRRQAKASRDFMNKFLSAVEGMRNAEPNEVSADATPGKEDFYEVNY